MENYKSLFVRGVNYVYRSIQIWNKRKEKLRSLLLRHLSNPCRIVNLLKALEERIEKSIQFISRYSERKRRQDREALSDVIELVCTDVLCGLEMKKLKLYVTLEDYAPGKYKCPRCRSVLSTIEDLEINQILDELNISLPAK